MAQATTQSTSSAFVAKLLAPVVAPRENRRYLAELRHEAETAWAIVLHRFYAAKAWRDVVAHRARADALERRIAQLPDWSGQAQLDMIAAVDKMMMVPAPNRGALRQKMKLRGLSGGRERWEAAIAADCARLGVRD